MNRHDQSRSRNEETPLSVGLRWRLVHLGALAVGAAGSPGPRVLLPRRGRWILQRGLVPRHHYVGVGPLVGLVVRLLGGNFAAAAAVGPVHPALPPTGLVEQLHGPAARRVRVQEELRVLQDRPAGITSDLHDLESSRANGNGRQPALAADPLAAETFARGLFSRSPRTPKSYCAKVSSRAPRGDNPGAAFIR